MGSTVGRVFDLGFLKIRLPSGIHYSRCVLVLGRVQDLPDGLLIRTDKDPYLR